MKVNIKKLEVTPHSKIVHNLFKKKKLLEEGDHSHKEIRPLLIVLGGGMRGVSGGGAAVGLNLLGLNEVFDMAIGTSAGAPIIAYFLAGTEQSYLGTSLFYDEFRNDKFINMKNLSKILNLEWMGRVMTAGHKKLNTISVAEHRTPLYVSFTDYIDGTEQLFNVKDYPHHIVKMLEISSAMPFLYKKKLQFDGRQFFDGSVAFSIRRTFELPIIKKLNPTDILVITNTTEKEILTKERNNNFIKNFMNLLYSHTEHLLLRNSQTKDDIQYLSSLHGVNIGLMMTPPLKTPISFLSTDAKKLWNVGDDALKYTLECFGKPELYKPLNKPQGNI